jgi:hypothetical protein
MAIGWLVRRLVPTASKDSWNANLQRQECDIHTFKYNAERALSYLLPDTVVSSDYAI